MEAMTLIEIEYHGKTITSIRDISVPCDGDFMHIDETIYEIVQRHWVFDKNQSHRTRELRCILVCEKAK